LALNAQANKVAIHTTYWNPTSCTASSWREQELPPFFVFERSKSHPDSRSVASLPLFPFGYAQQILKFQHSRRESRDQPPEIQSDQIDQQLLEIALWAESGPQRAVACLPILWLFNPRDHRRSRRIPCVTLLRSVRSVRPQS
jgi:hypothetical protein